MTKSKEELPKKKANIYVYTRRYGKTLMNSIMQIDLTSKNNSAYVKEWNQTYLMSSHEQRRIRHKYIFC